MHQYVGYLITSEGIDGSGKGVVVDTWKEFLEDKDMRALELRNEKYNFYPEFEYVPDHDVLVVNEPTWWGIGKTIREALIRKGTKHSAKVLTYAFSLDRQVLYERLILPALDAGKIVLQDRSVGSTIAYQLLQAEIDGENLTLADVMELDATKLAMNYAPSLLAISRLPATEAIARLEERDKDDDVRYENLSFQDKLLQRYVSDWFREIYEERETKVVYIDTSKTVEDTQQQARTILEDFLNEKGIL